MQTLIYGSSLLTAFLGGVLALFAPCCIVSLLPTYIAATLRVARWRLVELTGLFALGVAVILLPIVLGIGALGQVLNGLHREVFFLGGVLMLGLGASALAGKGWALPMPMLRRPDAAQGGAVGTLLLGVFSGVVSSCCAPVLGGVLVLSATASSLGHALGLGLAYVLGMVFPLFLAALLWDRLRLGDRGTFRSRTVSVTLAGHPLRWRVTDLGAGVLFVGMGGLMVGLALTGRSTYTPEFLLGLNRWGSDRLAALAHAARGIPEGWFGVALVVLLLALVALAWPRGRSVRLARRDHKSAVPPSSEVLPARQEPDAP
jgi:cytochrome c-type biogenesis protein